MACILLVVCPTPNTCLPDSEYLSARLRILVCPTPNTCLPDSEYLFARLRLLVCPTPTTCLPDSDYSTRQFPGGFSRTALYIITQILLSNAEFHCVSIIYNINVNYINNNDFSYIFVAVNLYKINSNNLNAIFIRISVQ